MNAPDDITSCFDTLLAATAKDALRRFSESCAIRVTWLLRGGFVLTTEGMTCFFGWALPMARSQARLSGRLSVGKAEQEPKKLTCRKSFARLLRWGWNLFSRPAFADWKSIGKPREKNPHPQIKERDFPHLQLPA